MAILVHNICAKMGLIQASNFSNSKVCNLARVWPKTLKFVASLSQYLRIYTLFERKKFQLSVSLAN